MQRHARNSYCRERSSSSVRLGVNRKEAPTHRALAERLRHSTRRQRHAERTARRLALLRARAHERGQLGLAVARQRLALAAKAHDIIVLRLRLGLGLLHLDAGARKHLLHHVNKISAVRHQAPLPDLQARLVLEELGKHLGLLARARLSAGGTRPVFAVGRHFNVLKCFETRSG